MALDEENNGAGIKTSKKPKHKKIPQRGLGVAQLERLRLAEQQRTAISATTCSSTPPPQSLALPLPPSSSASPAMSIDFFSSSSSENSQISMARNARVGFFLPPPRMWIPPPAHLPADVPDNTTSSELRVRRSLHQQQQRPLLQRKRSNLSSASASPVPGVDPPLQIEPPSNQSYDLLSCWKDQDQEQDQDQDKMGSLKRLYPFRTDGLPAYPSKIPSSSYVKLEEPSHGNSFMKPESKHLALRGGCSSCLTKRPSFFDPRAELVRHRCSNRNEENNNGQADRNFLTLGSISPQASSKPMSSSSSSHSDYMQYGLQGSQGSSSSIGYKSFSLSLQEKPRPFYTFLSLAKDIPETKQDDEQRAENVVAEVDLNLKL